LLFGIGGRSGYLPFTIGLHLCSRWPMDLAAHALADAEAGRPVLAEQAEAVGVIHRRGTSLRCMRSSGTYRVIRRWGEQGEARFGYAAEAGQSGYQESA
jgi:hypothetical protein